MEIRFLLASPEADLDEHHTQVSDSSSFQNKIVLRYCALQHCRWWFHVYIIPTPHVPPVCGVLSTRVPRPLPYKPPSPNSVLCTSSLVLLTLAFCCFLSVYLQVSHMGEKILINLFLIHLTQDIFL